VYGSGDGEVAARGHLEIVQWLHANRIEGCTTKTMDDAAFNGDLEVVKWLPRNCSEACTTSAMNDAAISSHVNRSEGYTTEEMDTAVPTGCLEVAREPLRGLHNRGNRWCDTKWPSGDRRVTPRKPQ